MSRSPSDPQETASGTPGGLQLRALRRRMCRTQLDVELEAELGTGYLQRLESGRVQQPVRPTLERILDALDARFTERREILELFGYLVRVPLPDDAERAWASTVSRPEIEAFPFPAYVLDCGHRLILWNEPFSRLFGANGDQLVRSRLTSGSFLAAWFDSGSPLWPMLVEPELTLPALLRAFRHEMMQFPHADWYRSLLDELTELEEFKHYLRRAETEEGASSERALMPIRLHVREAGDLRFRLSAEQFTRDTRFRIIYYFPSDVPTMRAFEPGECLGAYEIGPTKCS